MSSYFPNRWPLSYLNLTKNMKTYIRRQQHKNFIHQDIKQKEPPQKYRLGTISNTKLLAGLNRFYMAITSPSASAVVHKFASDCINYLVFRISFIFPSFKTECIYQTILHRFFNNNYNSSKGILKSCHISFVSACEL